MTITNLDFRELKEIDDPGFGLQALIANIGRKLGFAVELGGRGADQGRDVFFEGSSTVIHALSLPVKILVNCKDTAISGRQITANDIAGFHGRVAQHRCNGFILAATVPVTNDLVVHIREVAAANNFQATIWQPTDIKGILLDQQDALFRFTIARFFPNSSRVGDSSQHAADYFFDSLDFMDKYNTLSLSLDFIKGMEDHLLIWECIEKLTEVPDIDFQRDLFEHFKLAFGLNNEELTAVLLDEIHEPLNEWAQVELDWEDSEVEVIEPLGEKIKVSVLGIRSTSRMGENVSDSMTAEIEWTNEGFKLLESNFYVDDPDDERSNQ